MVNDRDVLDVVQRLALELAGVAQQGLDLFHAGFGQRHRALLLVDVVIGLVELGKERVDGVVEFRTIVERPGDDQAAVRALVDQDGVGPSSDDGVEVAERWTMSSSRYFMLSRR